MKELFFPLIIVGCLIALLIIKSKETIQGTVEKKEESDNKKVEEKKAETPNPLFLIQSTTTELLRKKNLIKSFSFNPDFISTAKKVEETKKFRLAPSVSDYRHYFLAMLEIKYILKNKLVPGKQDYLRLLSVLPLVGHYYGQTGANSTYYLTIGEYLAFLTMKPSETGALTFDYGTRKEIDYLAENAFFLPQGNPMTSSYFGKHQVFYQIENTYKPMPFFDKPLNRTFARLSKPRIVFLTKYPQYIPPMSCMLYYPIYNDNLGQLGFSVQSGLISIKSIGIPMVEDNTLLTLGGYALSIGLGALTSYASSALVNYISQEIVNKMQDEIMKKLIKKAIEFGVDNLKKTAEEEVAEVAAGYGVKIESDLYNKFTNCKSFITENANAIEKTYYNISTKLFDSTSEEDFNFYNRSLSETFSFDGGSK